MVQIKGKIENGVRTYLVVVGGATFILNRGAMDYYKDHTLPEIEYDLVQLLRTRGLNDGAYSIAADDEGRWTLEKVED